jgi:hypothetical protein
MIFESAYRDIRKDMLPGDVIAFGGKGRFSNIIKVFTRSAVSHVGVILQTQLLIDGEGQPGYLNQVIESTSLNGFSGVSINRLSDRLDHYNGEVWWLPLSESVRAKLNVKKFFNFLLHQEGKKYDSYQAIQSALDMIPDTAEDFGQFFCSELVVAGLEAGGVFKDINASEVTPADLVMWKVYATNYHQIKGGRKFIHGFNSINPW